MPTYEYQCKKCNQLFEAFQAITEKPIKKCPSCGGAVKRLIGAGSGLIFKGSGFYITDYKMKENQSGKTSIKKSSNTEIKKKKSDDTKSDKSSKSKNSKE